MGLLEHTQLRYTLFPSPTAASGPAFQLVQDGGSSRDVSKLGKKSRPSCAFSGHGTDFSPRQWQVWELKDGFRYSCSSQREKKQVKLKCKCVTRSRARTGPSRDAQLCLHPWQRTGPIHALKKLHYSGKFWILSALEACCSQRRGWKNKADEFCIPQRFYDRQGLP